MIQPNELKELCMKADELKNILKDYSKDELIKLYSKTYRMVPKERRETEVDEMIRSHGAKPEPKKKDEDFSTIREEILLFEDNALAQLYLRRNRSISEKKRRNWRFDVKRCIKYLDQIPEDSPNYAEATSLLLKIFHVLSTGCGIWLFSPDQPFQSVGIAQSKLFDMICARALKQDDHGEILKSLIRQAAVCHVDYETLHDMLIDILLSEFNSPALLNEIIVLAKINMEEETDRFKTRRRSSFGDDQFWYKERMNNFTRLIMQAYICLDEADEGIRFFHEHFTEHSEEVKLYILLKYLAAFELYDLWIREYEAALRKKVKPRDSLKEAYEKIKKDYS